MKKKIIILLTLMFFVPFAVKAYEVREDFEKNHGGNHFYSVVSTEDGGFIAAGTSSSTDIEGLTNKGGTDGIIVKYDKDGNMLWQTNWGGNDYDHFKSVVQTLDGGYIVVGYTSSTDIEGLTKKGVNDAIVVKYDKDGKMLWQTNYGGNDTDRFYSVVSTEDGGFIAVGSSSSKNIEGITPKGNADSIIVRYDKDGNMLWQKNWGGGYDDLFESVTLALDGGFIAAGSSQPKDIEGMENKDNRDGIIVKYDEDGNMLWQKNWGGTGTEFFHSIAITLDGGYIVAGYSSAKGIEGITPKGNEDGIIVRYDKDGNMLWQTNWGGSATDKFFSVRPTLDGGYIVAGYSISDDIEGITNRSDMGAIIVKYDKDGNMLWQTSYDKRNVRYFYSIDLTKESGYIVGGDTTSNRAIILKYSIEYNLEMTTMENGTATVKQNGNLGIITPIPNEGYSVDNVIVKDTAGNEISVTELEDGTYSFELYDDVSIEVSFARAYHIDVKEYINGKADIVKSDDNIVLIVPIADKGYELDKIVVKNSKGEIVEVTKLEDETYSFELNDDVSVEVLFKEEIINPKTGMSNIIGLLFTMALCFISGLFVLKNYNKSYEI